jgi:2-polyprenyl-3-methyl-5-hydroxy-6-metoxy-1,4-benzoquinol methylase
MAFEDVMGIVSRWSVATEALAALGAELTLKQSGEAAPPEIAAALSAVSVAAGLGDLDELAPQQQAIVAALVRLTLRQATDVLDHPAREAGWTYTDPVILDGWGRGSGMVPMLIAANPELREVSSFLDVGTGVGLLAVAAAGVWPTATIVGIDTWDPSLERARANVTQGGVDDRVTLRKQNVVDLEDDDQYDCIWVPTFFLTEVALTEALPKLMRAARPGGWIVLGRFAPPPDPVADATVKLRTIRGGGFELEAKRAVELLDHAGCSSVHAAPRMGPAPMELILGQKPA